MFSVHQIIALRDNYVYFLTDISSGETIVIDPGESLCVMEYCMHNDIIPKFILNTHHHWDHVGGNLDLKDAFGLQIVGYKGDKGRIPGIDIQLDEGDTFTWGGSSLEVMCVPGHTTGHIAYYSAENKSLFCGDTMFSMGCGGNFEGTYAQLYDSLLKFKALPDDTLVYCGHEYTAAGLMFARKFEGSTEALTLRQKDVVVKNTIPSTIGIEKATNPFLRCDSPAIRQNLGLSINATDFEVFTALRDY